MKILYIHGFGSKANPLSDKVKALESLGVVHCIDPDYTLGYEFVYNLVVSLVKELKIDLVVGTSMGGYLAGDVGYKLDIPHVMINPASEPSESLKKYLGASVDHYGRKYYLSDEAINSYPNLKVSVKGLILLDLGDEVISSLETYNKFDGICSIEVFEGGSHRFEHIDESIVIIEDHYNFITISLGIIDD